MALGLSFRAAAQRVDCTHRAISKAVGAGRIALLPDGTVAAEAVDAWNAHRRTPRGGAHRIPAKSPDGSRVSLARADTLRGFGDMSDAVPGAPSYLVPQIIANVSTMLETGAVDLALVALRYMPVPLARQVTEAWLFESLAGWVGTPSSRFPEPVAVVSEWPTPPGCARWCDHALFLPSAILPSHWPELEEEAAAWRAEHGAPAA